MKEMLQANEEEGYSRSDKVKFTFLALGVCVLWPMLLILFPFFIFTSIQIAVRLLYGALRFIFARVKFLLKRWAGKKAITFVAA